MDPKLEAAQEELTSRVLDRPGINGTAIGERGGKPCLLVYVSDSKAGKQLPKSVGGYPVVMEMAGPFSRY